MKIIASAEGRIEAPASRVYAYLADFRHHHPNFLPPQFSDLVVEQNGYGAGTVFRFTLTAGGRASTARVRVEEPEPGHVMTETQIDGAREMTTTFTVEPAPRGMSRVRIETELESSGVRSLVERIAVPRMLRRLYAEELRLLDDYARGLSRTTPRIVTASRGVVVT
jgi:uncharacterized protein YndB with AHSA1/START domain